MPRLLIKCSAKRLTTKPGRKSLNLRNNTVSLWNFYDLAYFKEVYVNLGNSM